MLTNRSRVGLFAALLALVLVLPASAFAGGAARTLEGTLVVAHGEDYSRGAPRAVWFTDLVTTSGKVKLAFEGDRPAGFLNGARVRVRGTLTNGTLAVGRARGDAQVMAAASATTGAHRLAVLLVKFGAADPEPYTVEQARGVIFDNANSVANYFAEESYGLLTMTGDVFGYYTISIDQAACDFTDIGDKARAAAAAAGVDLSGYSQIQYVHNYLPSCGWSGLAWVPGRDSWLNQALSLRVSAHELSHNFGVHHASSMSCTEGGTRVTLSATAASCTSSEYGDPFSVMGAASTRHTHSQQLASLGWISGSGLQTITSAGTYQLAAAEDSSSTAPRAVRIARTTGSWFYLELRKPWGTQFDNFSASDPAVTGVTIRMSSDWTSIVQSQLLDATPATTTFSDAPLAVGQSFHDPLSDLSITTVAVSGGVATVTVAWSTDTTPPSAPTNLRVSSLSKAKVTFAWGGSSDNVGVAGYRVYRAGKVVATVTGTTWTDTRQRVATTYYVVAFDAAGNVSAASNSVTVGKK